MRMFSSIAQALHIGRRAAAGICAICVRLVLSLVVPSAAAQCTYEVTIIPHPYSGLQFTAGLALNELGHVAGRNSSGGDTERAFFWSPETGTYVLPYPPGIINMLATGINDHDQICGHMHNLSQWYGFIWDRTSGAYTVIQRPAWATRIEVRDINNDGFVTGTLYNDGSGAVHPFVWHDGVLYDFASYFKSPYNHAYSISEQNEVVGHAWNPIIGSGFALEPLGTVEMLEDSYLTYTMAIDNSNNACAVGRGSPVDPQGNGFRWVGTIWQGSSVTLIEPRPTSRDTLVYGINDAGRAVGMYDRTSPNGPESGFVWQHGRLTLLNELVPSGTPNVASARCINNAGQNCRRCRRPLAATNPGLGGGRRDWRLSRVRGRLGSSPFQFRPSDRHVPPRGREQ